MTSEKMNDPSVKQAIRLLRARGVTLEQIKKVYDYYERIEKLGGSKQLTFEETIAKYI